MALPAEKRSASQTTACVWLGFGCVRQVSAQSVPQCPATLPLVSSPGGALPFPTASSFFPPPSPLSLEFAAVLQVSCSFLLGCFWHPLQVRACPFCPSGDSCCLQAESPAAWHGTQHPWWSASPVMPWACTLLFAQSICLAFFGIGQRTSAACIHP